MLERLFGKRRRATDGSGDPRASREEEDGRGSTPPARPRVTVLPAAGRAELEVRHDVPGGSPIPGVTGARILSRSAERAVLRIGPPPAARWELVGLRSVVVLAGKLTLVDGDESRDVEAGQAALVSEPSAPLSVQAGNDAAIAIAFSAPDVVVRLR